MSESKANGKPDSVKIPVYNQAGKVLEHLDVPVASLGGFVRRDLLRQAVIAYEANKRRGTAKTKTRAEVAYSGAKPWPQKGTGRARAGTRASTIWVGGGVAHGPKVRDYSKKLNKKMRKKAIASALLGKALDGEVSVVDELQIDPPKTREIAAFLKNAGVNRSFMIVTEAQNQMLWRSARNIPGASVRHASELNAYEVLKSKNLIFIRRAFELVLENLSGLAATDTEKVEA